MELAEVDVEIERLTARRSSIWAGRLIPAVGELPKIEKRLAALYESKRHIRVKAPRREILARARVETELAKLMAGGKVKA